VPKQGGSDGFLPQSQVKVYAASALHDLVVRSRCAQWEEASVVKVRREVGGAPPQLEGVQHEEDLVELQGPLRMEHHQAILPRCKRWQPP